MVAQKWQETLGIRFVKDKRSPVTNSNTEQMANLPQIPNSPIVANDTPLLGAGMSAPDFCLKDTRSENLVRLSDFAGQDILLVFFRGTWCFNCRRQFRVLCENQERLREAGIAVVGVVCQSADSVRRFLEGTSLPFPLLADTSRAVAKQYGVHYWLSYEGFNLANPALFILDRERQITFAYRGKNQTDLPLSLILEEFIALLDPPCPGKGGL